MLLGSSTTLFQTSRLTAVLKSNLIRSIEFCTAVAFETGPNITIWYGNKLASLVVLLENKNHSSAIADHVKSTGHNMKWDHFEILTGGQSDTHCKIKETLLIRDM